MIFERIACGVNGSPESDDAVQQADLLMAPGGRMLLIGVADVAVAVHAGFQAPAIVDMIETEMRAALLDAEKSLAYGHAVHPRLLHGRPISCLISAAREEDATLVAVGTHGSGRVEGILLGSVATAMLHEAPCSVLLARAGAEKWSPRSIVVGHDGSRGARTASRAGEELRTRFGSQVTALAATGGKILDIDGLRDVRGLEFDGGLEFDERKPVDALMEASKEAGRPRDRGKPRAARPRVARKRQRACRSQVGLLRPRRSRREHVMQRLAVIAKLKPDAGDRAVELIKEGPPFDPQGAGFQRHSVYLTGDEVTFVFEGGLLDVLLKSVLQAPQASARFHAWEPLP